MRPTPARLLVALAALLAVAQFRADAQGQARIPRVGWLQNNSAGFGPYEGFREGLRQLGYVDGVNLAIEIRSADGDHDRLAKLAGELANAGSQVLFVAGDPGLEAAKQATDTIPIVVLACDPLHGLVQSLARPRGGATGLTCVSSDLAGKRLELLKELVPGLSRVAVLYNPKEASKVSEFGQVKEAARLLGITAQPFEAGQPSQFTSAFAAMKAADVHGLLMLADSLMNFHIQALADLALRERLPVQEPTKFEFVLNLNTAKALGLTIPPSLLARADEVIE